MCVSVCVCANVSSSLQIFDICWDPFQQNRLVSCGVKHIKVTEPLHMLVLVSSEFVFCLVRKDAGRQKVL